MGHARWPARTHGHAGLPWGRSPAPRGARGARSRLLQPVPPANAFPAAAAWRRARPEAPSSPRQRLRPRWWRHRGGGIDFPAALWNTHCTQGLSELRVWGVPTGPGCAPSPLLALFFFLFSLRSCFLAAQLETACALPMKRDLKKKKQKKRKKRKRRALTCKELLKTLGSLSDKQPA